MHEFHFTEARSIVFLRRRTADVRTVGYVECFVLAKEDVLSAIRDYPEAQVKNTETLKIGDETMSGLRLCYLPPTATYALFQLVYKNLERKKSQILRARVLHSSRYCSG